MESDPSQRLQAGWSQNKGPVETTFRLDLCVDPRYRSSHRWGRVRDVGGVWSGLAPPTARLQFVILVFWKNLLCFWILEIVIWYTVCGVVWCGVRWWKALQHRGVQRRHANCKRTRESWERKWDGVLSLAVFIVQYISDEWTSDDREKNRDFINPSHCWVTIKASNSERTDIWLYWQIIGCVPNANDGQEELGANVAC